MRQILQELPYPFIDYFVKRDPGNGKNWTNGFDNLKAALSSDSALQRYYPDTESVLQCDASSVDVGDTVRQPGPDDSLQPVAYAPRIRTGAEQNYSQIE